MNFNKAKKILIFLFAFLNLFLIFQLSKMTDTRTTVSISSIRKTVQLAEARGVLVSEDVIPRKIEVLSFLELSNPLHDKADFFSEFTNFKDISSVREKMFVMNFKGEKFQNEKELLSFFNKSGFSPYSLKFEHKISNPIMNEDIYFFSQVYNSKIIYGSGVNAKLENGGLSTLSGNVYKITDVKMNDYTPVSPLQIILTFSRILDGRKAVIDDINQGYYIPSDSKNYKNITAIPCYILDVDSYKFIFDAEKGDFMVRFTENGSFTPDIEQAVSFF